MSEKRNGLFQGEAEILERAAQEYQSSNPNFPIDTQNTALLVIDLQEGFVAEGARMWTPENLRILPRVKTLIERCRKLGMPVIFTEHCHDSSGRDKGLMWDVPLNRPINEGALRIGAEDTATYHEIAPLPGEKVIPKHRYSAFYDTDLDTYLTGCGVDTVIITGCMTNYCCGATARDAFFRNFKVIFGSDLTATDSRELHEAELKTLRRGYARVIPLGEILREFDQE
jgi:nicotinamidase-related amidase